MSAGAEQALRIERSCTLVASAFSEGGCGDVRLISGDRRGFGANARRTILQVPYPALEPDWSLRTWTCGVALQCAPSKKRIAGFTLGALTPRQSKAVSIVEGRVAIGWIGRQWPGLKRELQRVLPHMPPMDPDLAGRDILDQAMALAGSDQDLTVHPLLGRLPESLPPKDGFVAAFRRAQGRMPWSKTKRYLAPGFETIPVGGESDIKSSRLPPPSRPEDDDVDVDPLKRAGVPYPEWNQWTGKFLPDHVAVLERRLSPAKGSSKPVPAEYRRWFEQHTHRVMRGRLEDGSDIDVGRYIEHAIDQRMGLATEVRVFRELKPNLRDVSTALLLDGSASLGGAGGRTFKLELQCADALCSAMSRARERHGLFVFNGKTRHRVDVTCLKDFQDRQSAVPSDFGLATGGYTRLGAALRHMTSRLLKQQSERRLLIVIGDGLISDEGYEGRYAWADAAHAVEEAQEAGVSLFYIGVGVTKVDPLPDVFGPRRSARIRRVEELPRILARVHHELVSS